MRGVPFFDAKQTKFDGKKAFKTSCGFSGFVFSENTKNVKMDPTWAPKGARASVPKLLVGLGGR